MLEVCMVCQNVFSFTCDTCSDEQYKVHKAQSTSANKDTYFTIKGWASIWHPLVSAINSRPPILIWRFFPRSVIPQSIFTAEGRRLTRGELTQFRLIINTQSYINHTKSYRANQRCKDPKLQFRGQANGTKLKLRGYLPFWFLLRDAPGNYVDNNEGQGSKPQRLSESPSLRPPVFATARHCPPGILMTRFGQGKMLFLIVL